ncbi:glycosyltransferase family protein [Mariniplasma anaerobium]|uniref:Uncharacterized protein n=1 Tax=Mariniplasma anaerobium TaxID=2735436 RepID=A0A7U9TLC7_9MOLU|nr:hypothetical protein [Mariniplasma anaerobium]BCR36097.1 hypothetical protein MPAN_009900 [Mariniplasma anaerobium]
MKKILMVTAFYLENNTSRPYHMKQYFESKGFKTVVVTTNFNHSTKTIESITKSNVVQLKVPTYSQTFSLKRILSHLVFGFKIKKILLNVDYDTVYIAVPPNYSAKIAAKIGRKLNKIVITDIIDIWPQNSGKFPVSYILKKWATMRDKTLYNSDLVLIETSGYKKYIDPIRKDYELVYLTKTIDYNPENQSNNITKFEKSINIAYLGNFSSSYDFKSLIEISKILSRKYIVKIVIIGDGYLKRYVLEELDKISIYYEDNGIVFSESEKHRLLKDCHFGYNAVNKNITVGLSYKSIDYLSYSLPLLNNIKFDTKKLVEEFNAGINFDSSIEACEKILLLTDEAYLSMRDGSYRLFKTHFSLDAFNNKMDEILKKRRLL